MKDFLINFSIAFNYTSLILVIGFFAVGCNNLTIPQEVLSPTRGVGNMIINPSLQLPSSRNTVLLDTVNNGFQVYTLPDLQLLFSRDSYENVQNFFLSGSGAIVGVLTINDELELFSQTSSTQYQLPYSISAIRSLVVSDTADKVAMLVVDIQNGQLGNGRLEIWSLPFGEQPLSTLSIPLFDFGFITTSPSFNTLALYSADNLGNQAFASVYYYESENHTLTSVWTESGQDVPQIPSHVVISDNWVWTVKNTGIEGLQRGETPVQLNGTLRDRLIISPNGQYLLVYRGLESINTSTVKMLFRLVDLSSQQEIRQVSHPIENASFTQFVLTDDLNLLGLQVTEEAQIELIELGW